VPARASPESDEWFIAKEKPFSSAAFAIETMLHIVAE
jgi:hypothetical protein